MILRIVDKQTNLFLRDDFAFDADTEIGLEVEPSQGLYQPKWSGEEWIEGASQEYIDSLATEPAEPTIEEKVAQHDEQIVSLAESIEVIFGG